MSVDRVPGPQLGDGLTGNRDRKRRRLLGFASG